jgi:hypothetical protein
MMSRRRVFVALRLVQLLGVRFAARLSLNLSLDLAEVLGSLIRQDWPQRPLSDSPYIVHRG